MIQGGGQDNPAGLSSPRGGGKINQLGYLTPPGAKISRVGGKLSRVGKMNCHTGAIGCGQCCSFYRETQKAELDVLLWTPPRIYYEEESVCKRERGYCQIILQKQICNRMSADICFSLYFQHM